MVTEQVRELYDEDCFLDSRIAALRALDDPATVARLEATWGRNVHLGDVGNY